MNARRSSSYSPVHAEWYEDPNATQPGDVLTLASSLEEVRAAYRRFGVRFEVGAQGALTMRMELALGSTLATPSLQLDNYTPT